MRDRHTTVRHEQNAVASGDLNILMTPDEAAVLLRTTRKAIYVMVERGLLPGVTRVGRRVLIRTEVLLDWLRRKSTPSPEGQRR